MVAAARTPGGTVAAGDASGTATASAGAIAPGGPPTGPHVFYDIASLTKVAATWPLAGRVAACGLLDLEAPMGRYFPEASGPGAGVTTRQILTHTSGLMASTRLDRYRDTPTPLAEAILAEPLEDPDTHRYINRGFILLGLLLERLTGTRLDLQLTDYAEQIGAPRITYGPMHRGPGTAPTEPRLPGGPPLWGSVHDENAALLGGAAGHAGVFANAEGLAAYARTLLADHARQGAFGDYVRTSWEPQVRIDGTTSRGLAWLVDDTGLVHHHGFTGTSLYLDPPHGRYLVLLTNAVHHGRRRPGLTELRARASKAFT
ncbi:beta-lactamase family protein [Nocardiopsis sp. CNT-189]|uniref:serine hydrolase domain-containing protein n=1 Tax=Nocardiopsis oceanisediminis TaxID=2816862 RepID=UPI003B2CD7AF